MVKPARLVFFFFLSRFLLRIEEESTKATTLLHFVFPKIILPPPFHHIPFVFPSPQRACLLCTSFKGRGRNVHRFK